MDVGYNLLVIQFKKIFSLRIGVRECNLQIICKLFLKGIRPSKSFYLHSVYSAPKNFFAIVDEPSGFRFNSKIIIPQDQQICQALFLKILHKNFSFNLCKITIKNIQKNY